MARLNDSVLRQDCLNDIVSFSHYFLPQYRLADLHEEFLQWLVAPSAQENKLGLLPRGHLKSWCLAVVAVWEITKDPTLTGVYLTSGKDLANLQIGMMKWILECDRYVRLWPEMTIKEEGKRDKWAAGSFNVDHPDRRAAGVRDYTMVVRTYKSNSTGLHCDRLYVDDIVNEKNHLTVGGRKEVERQYSFYNSVKNPEALVRAVGTRYDYRDIYGQWQGAVQLDITDDGVIVGKKPVWDVFAREVEDQGNGFGTFIWPRTKGFKKNYGFDTKVLLQKKAEYEANGERGSYYSQYYNKVTDPESDRLERSDFQYYNRKALHREDHGVWFYDGFRLRLGAGMDVAFTDITETRGSQADFTAIAVIGVNEIGQVFILDLAVFKTDKFDAYYEAVDRLYRKWGFPKITVETNAGGKFVAREIRKRVARGGSAYSVIGKPAARGASKGERYAASLEPRYLNSLVFHYEGGDTPELEDQIVEQNPKNDDIRDAVVIAVNETPAPLRPLMSQVKGGRVARPAASSRFGGHRRTRRQ